MEAPTMVETLFDPNLADSWRFHVHAERFEIADLAGKTDSELAEWLEQRWMVKCAKLQELQRDLEAGKDWGEKPGQLLNGKKTLQ